MVGTDQWPNQPIQGNAGTNIGQNSVMDFYYQTLKCFNHHYDASQIAYNPHGHCVNFSEVFLDQGANNYYDLGPSQNCYFKENRIKGMAVYGFEFTMEPQPYTYFTGMDTSQKKPWSLFIEYEGSNPYLGQSEFISFFNFDCVFRYDGQSWSVIGRN